MRVAIEYLDSEGDDEYLIYPDWVEEHLTPEYEEKTPCDPGKVELWFDLRQKACPYPSGHEVYEEIKKNGLLERSLSCGDLVWFKANPDKIPADFRGEVVCAWASVWRADDRFYVPCLDCVIEPYVRSRGLFYWWHSYVPAGLHTS